MTEIRKFRGISANFIKLQAFSRTLKKYWEFLRYFVTKNSWESFRTGKKGVFTTSLQAFQHFGTIVH